MVESNVLLIKMGCVKCTALLGKIKDKGWYDLIGEIKDFDKSTTVPPFIKDVPCLLVGDCTFIVGTDEIIEFLTKLDLE